MVAVHPEAQQTLKMQGGGLGNNCCILIARFGSKLKKMNPQKIIENLVKVSPFTYFSIYHIIVFINLLLLVYFPFSFVVVIVICFYLYFSVLISLKHCKKKNVLPLIL